MITLIFSGEYICRQRDSNPWHSDKGFHLYDLISSSILVAGILEVEAEFTETNAVVISIGTHYAIASRLCVQLHRFQNRAILFCWHKLMAE